MTFATKMFRFPFEPGEPITFPIKSFAWKDTYDKYYILDGKEPMSRFEVALAAVKHGILISTQETRPMNRLAHHVTYKGFQPGYNDTYKEAPEYFGMWTGRFIPILANFRISDRTPSETKGWSQEDAQRLAMSWTDEFFERAASFWFEMLMGKDHRGLDEYARTGRTVWVEWRMDTMWIPTYQELVHEGLPKSPGMEQAIIDITQYMPEEL